MRHSPSSLSCLAVIAALCAPAPAPAQEAPSRDRVLATVNGTDITLGHIVVLRAGLPEQYDEVDARTLFDGLLDQLVQQTLLADSIGDTPSPDVALMIENETRALLASDAINEVVEDEVSEEAIQAMYAERYSDADPVTEYSAAHILLKTEEEARDMIARLEDGAEFAALAREFSEGPSGPGGGDLGWFAEGMMVDSFFEAVTSLDIGAVSDPVQTDFGWHVITLKDTRLQGTPELEETRASIVDTLRREALEGELQRLEQGGTVERPDLSGIDPGVINDPSLLGR